MNNKGNKSYIIVFIILLICLLFVIYMLSFSKKDSNAKPMTTLPKTTKTTESTDNTTTKQIVIDNNKDKNTNVNSKLQITNFKASLYDIIKNITFFEQYYITTYYHGVEFTFRCNDYDSSKLTCNAGSALMKINDSLYPLYTYYVPEDNYLNNSKSYYIILNDSMVVLANTGIKNNLLRVFDNKGNIIKSVKGIIFKYAINEIDFKNIYPTIDDDFVYYYKCISGNPYIYSINLKTKEEKRLESISGKCS